MGRRLGGGATAGYGTETGISTTSGGRRACASFGRCFAARSGPRSVTWHPRRKWRGWEAPGPPSLLRRNPDPDQASL